MARFRVVMTQPDGSRVVLARTRRFNGAINERDLAIDSKRAQFLKHANGDRVVTGPTTDPNGVAVVLIAPSGDVVFTYSVEVDMPDPANYNQTNKGTSA